MLSKLVRTIRVWIVIALLVFALVGLLLFARLEDPAIVAVTEHARDSEKHTNEQVTSDATVEPLTNGQTDASSSELAPLIINWRASPYPDFPFPKGSPLENYHYFKLLAESGNGFAAYQLAEMMSGCSHSFLTQEELDSAIAQLRETFTYVDPELNATVRLGDQAKVNEFITGQTKQFENCRDFTAEQRHEHLHWLELAANNGYALAMLDYGRQLEDPQASLELYRSAWQQGESYALLSLAEGLERIYDEGIDPTAKVPAYAAQHAFVTLLQETHGSDPERVVGRWTLRNRAKLDEMAKEMRQAELEAAVQLSRQMITSNKNCCFAM